MANITRWNPIEDMLNAWPASFFNRDLFGWRKGDGPAELAWSPHCDVTEADGTLLVQAELPGVDQEDIEVNVEGGMLTISGEKRCETKEEEKGHTYSERFFGSFQRSISIPQGVDQSKIEAKLKHGVLEVRVPLPASAKSEATKVEIKAV
ncbi:MAG: Hsp20/alpha crystallin family protein [Anaerolineaceae bacterium]